MYLHLDRKNKTKNTFKQKKKQEKNEKQKKQKQKKQTKDSCTKINAIARLEFELADYDVAVQHISHYAMQTSTST